jgi:hypothetical protein
MMREHSTEAAKPSGPFAEELSGPASVKTMVWAQAPDMDGAGPAQAALAAKAPQPAPSAPRRVGTIAALRVAVLATSAPGEVRLIALDTADEPPPGAALAVLVPLSAADGDSVSRLFGGLE